MSYQINYDEKRKIAELIFNNPISLEEKKKARSEVDSICIRKRSKQVLVEMSKIITTGKLQTLDLYESEPHGGMRHYPRR